MPRPSVPSLVDRILDDAALGRFTTAEAITNLEKIAQETQAWVLDHEEKEDKALLDKMRGAGIKVNTANRDAFVNASAPIYAEFAKEVPGGKELIDRALALAKQ